MKLRVWVGIRILCFIGLLVASLSRGALAATRPNIVFLMADDAGYNEFGFTNDLNNAPSPADTPNIDALAADGVVASRVYADPLCTPSRAGLLTGQYPQRYGLENVLGGTPGFINTPQGLNANNITVADRLKTLGYSTGAIGKWHLGYQEGVNRPLDAGFDEFYGILSGGRSSYFSNQFTLSDEVVVRRGNQDIELAYRNEGDHSLYDPVRGRYLTDAIGEEAADFVARHAGDANPFFLYVPFTAPHDPLDAKQQDYHHFANITNTTQRTVLAMNYAMDRAVGSVIDRLKDPNHDGNQSDSVYDNTIVVFTNDNGGALLPGFNYNRDNTPWNGYKGTTWEGGLRVPFEIKAPGLQGGTVYNGPMTFLDMLPTFVNAAGGDATGIDTDGYDVMPLLKGQQANDPHQTMFARSFDAYAVWQGKWVITSEFQGSPGPFLYDLEADPGQINNLIVTRQDIAQPLLRELTFWEARLAKPAFGPGGFDNQNTFDHFVFRNDQAGIGDWTTPNTWFQGGTTNAKTLRSQDAYANAILEFRVNNTADYVSNNDMDRMSKFQAFMLNQLRFTGDFTGTADRQGALTGKKLLLVKNLAQQLPQLRFDATSSGTANKFTYTIGNELQLLDNLEITGNGTQNFVINSAIKDYWDPRSVTKTGSSLVTLGGASTFKGTLTVNGGTLRLAGASASMNGPSSIIVGAAGNFTLDNGVVTVPTIDTSSGGLFNLNGGTLKVVNVTGNLANSGGVFSPGASPALSTISGNFTQTAGSLLMELGGTDPGVNFDQLVIGGAANLGGILTVQLINGFSPTLFQSFMIMQADGGIHGLFDASYLPTLPGNLSWRVLYGANTLSLQIGPPGGPVNISPPGDYNHDGKVDAADYTRWRDTFDSTTLLGADGDGDGIIDSGDYDTWKLHFGEVSGVGTGSSRAVPEPGSFFVILAAAIALPHLRRSRPVCSEIEASPGV